MMRSRLAWTVLALCATAPLHAQPYPSRIVRYVVPTPPGSGADVIGRIVAGGLAQAFGQQVVIDNRGGAGNNIGAEFAAKAPADGYTLFQVSLTHAVNVTLYRKLGYDLVRDFTPVIQLASSPYFVIVHPSLPVKSIADLVRLAKAQPGAINYASAGSGTSSYLAAEMLKEQTGINLLHVPYRGGSEALTSVMSGETSVHVSPVATTLPFLRDKRLRALAVTTPKRLAVAPEFPTVAESGYRDYTAGNWFGIMLPVNTPKDIVPAVREAALSALGNAEVSKRLVDLGYVIVGDRPEEFAAHIRAEIDKLGKVIRRAGLSVD
jgi:tripartite-type tricarboxylate transporter receptor subunit TctC